MYLSNFKGYNDLSNEGFSQNFKYDKQKVVNLLRIFYMLNYN